MIASLKLTDREVTLMPLTARDRLALFNCLIDCSDRPAVAPLVCFAAIGFVWERVAKAEAGMKASARELPQDVSWPTLAKCDNDIYAYGGAVLDALTGRGESMTDLLKQGDAISLDAFRSIQPPPAVIEEAAKNSEPEKGGSPSSSGSESVTAPTP